MNELDYASFEASKKLYDAGIILETKKYFKVVYTKDSDFFYLQKNNGTDAANVPVKMEHIFKIPAPCFTEVWRELPEQTYIKQLCNISMVWLCDEDKGIESPFFECQNPTDALIELKIWLKGLGNE